MVGRTQICQVFAAHFEMIDNSRNKWASLKCRPCYSVFRVTTRWSSSSLTSEWCNECAKQLMEQNVSIDVQIFKRNKVTWTNVKIRKKKKNAEKEEGRKWRVTLVARIKAQEGTQTLAHAPEKKFEYKCSTHEEQFETHRTLGSLLHSWQLHARGQRHGSSAYDEMQAQKNQLTRTFALTTAYVFWCILYSRIEEKLTLWT